MNASRRSGPPRKGQTSWMAVTIAAMTLLFSIALGTRLLPAQQAEREAATVQAVLSNPEASRGSLLSVRQRLGIHVRSSPGDAALWLRLAFADVRLNGGLGPDGQEALKRSYEVAPFGPEVTLWRLAFVHDNWARVPPQVRTAARTEMDAVFPRRRWELEALAPTLRDPTGRMVFALALRRNLLASESERRG